MPPIAKGPLDVVALKRAVVVGVLSRDAIDVALARETARIAAVPDAVVDDDEAWVDFVALGVDPPYEVDRAIGIGVFLPLRPGIPVRERGPHPCTQHVEEHAVNL